MTKEQKERLFQDNIVAVENLFLRHVPEMQHVMGDAEKKEGYKRIFEIHDEEGETIPGFNLSLAVEAVGTTLHITHYKLTERKDDNETNGLSE